jgi:hypothetical protein
MNLRCSMISAALCKTKLDLELNEASELEQFDLNNVRVANSASSQVEKTPELNNVNEMPANSN